MPAYENPVVVEFLRGGDLEAQHRGAWCVFLGDTLVSACGEIDRPYFLRSAAKFFQAIPSLVAGIQERYGLEDRALALMGASHGGEPEHVLVARSMLAAGGLEVSHLGCGAHPPLHPQSAAELRALGAVPSALHNNCSGKHAGMLLGAQARGEPLEGYLDPQHPLQRAIKDLMCEFAEASATEVFTRIDGCSAPTFVMTLRAAARAFRNYAQGSRHLGPSVDRAATRMRAAIAAHPLMLAGHDRFCTAVVSATKGRVLVKVGAEGFYGALDQERRAGLALHIDDGSSSASERLLAALLHRQGLLTPEELALIGPCVSPLRRNHSGIVVGEVIVHAG